jgi:hypothetical protein
VIFPFGGERTPDLVLPSQRVPRLRTFADADGIRPFEASYLPDVPVCFDRAGVGRDRHGWDKDGRCVFCERRRISKWRA